MSGLPGPTRYERELLRSIHPAYETHEPRVGSERRELRIHTQKRHRMRLLVERAIEPAHRLIGVAECEVNLRDLVGRHVAVRALFLDRPQHAKRRIGVAGRGQCVRERQ